MVKTTETETTKSAAEHLLLLMGIEAEADAEKTEDGILVNILTDQAPILIGRHGETLAAFQLVLAQILYKETGSSQRVLVDCGGWRAKQENALQRMAQDAAQKVVETQEPQRLYSLRADERRIVHMALADHPEVTTKSEGEGKDRHIVIEPRGKTP